MFPSLASRDANHGVSMIYNYADREFVQYAAKLAGMSLEQVLFAATGRSYYSAEELCAHYAEYNIEGKVALRVHTADLNKALKEHHHEVPVDDHNYRRRYGTTGDKEYWENAINRNPATKLGILGIDFTNYEGKVLMDHLSLGNDATYINAMMRDNNWKTTVIITSPKTASRLLWGAKPHQQKLTLAFVKKYEPQIIEALGALPRGTIIGEAIKLNQQKIMGHPGFSLAELMPQGANQWRRSDLWSFRGEQVTTFDLLSSGNLPPAQVAVQVHHQMVSAFVRHDAPLKDVVPAEVAHTYLMSNGDFALAS